jgi:hypothetical protein
MLLTFFLHSFNTNCHISSQITIDFSLTFYVWILQIFKEFLTLSYRNATNLQHYFENSKDAWQIANFTMQSQTTIVVNFLCVLQKLLWIISCEDWILFRTHILFYFQFCDVVAIIHKYYLTKFGDIQNMQEDSLKHLFPL